MLIHGGAGTILKKNMSTEKEAAYRAKLTEAIQAGYLILKKGGSSSDAITAAIVILENSPLFNAGKGAVFNSQGKNELDASFMEGADLQAGAVAVVSTIKNPVLAARSVLIHSPHVLLSGSGAEQFARNRNLKTVTPSYFQTKNNRKQFKKNQRNQTSSTSVAYPEETPSKFGTVGAVALDRYGHLAAATSTGGLSNKKFGRIGDSPIIGAGTYADDKTCAVSCTGQGEYFIRGVIAYDVAARMQYKNVPLQVAAKSAIQKVTSMGGLGGLIALDREGNIAMPFNTPGMYRGWVNNEGKIKVFLYK